MAVAVALPLTAATSTARAPIRSERRARRTTLAPPLQSGERRFRPFVWKVSMRTITLPTMYKLFRFSVWSPPSPKP